MSTITSRMVVGALVSTAFALHCAFGGDTGNGTTTDSTTSTTKTAATSGNQQAGGKTTKTDKTTPKIYWLIRRIDAVTDSGVVGLHTGTKVTYVGPGKNGLLKVKTDDNIVFEVSKDQLTTDPDQAAILAQEEAQQDAAQQAALIQQQQAAALAAATQPAQTFVLPAPAQQPSSSSAGSLGGTSLDKGAYNQVVSPKPKPTPRPQNVVVR